MIYLIHGNEEFLRAEALRKLIANLDSPETADLNTTQLDGRTVTLRDLTMSADTVPFLAPRRLVIVEFLLGRLVAKGKKKGSDADKAFLSGLTSYLEGVPETTDLVFVEQDAVKRGHPVFKALQPLLKSKQAAVIECDLPRRRRELEDRLVGWIEKRVRDKGGSITRDTVHTLIQTVGGNLRLLDQELEKLVTFTEGKRDIRPDDVQLLVTEAAETNIFEMVDAVGQGNGRKAITLLHQLLNQGAHPLYLLSMIVRQYRILLQVKDLIGRGGRRQDIASELKLRDFVVEKMVRQARRYSLPQLEDVYERLLATDVAIKTGQMEAVLAIDLLVAELVR